MQRGEPRPRPTDVFRIHDPRSLRTAVLLAVVGVLGAGCSGVVPGTASPAEPELPLVWHTTVVSQGFVALDSVRIRSTSRSDGAELLQEVDDGRLRAELAAAIAAAPPGLDLYLGAIDRNCRPAREPALTVQDHRTVLSASDESGDQGECEAHHTSYAVVAIDPATADLVARLTG